MFRFYFFLYFSPLSFCGCRAFSFLRLSSRPWRTCHAPPCVVSSVGPSVLSLVSVSLPFRVVLVLSCVYLSTPFLLSFSVLLLLSIFLVRLVCIFDPPRLCYCRRVSRGFLLLVSLCCCRGIPCTRRYCLWVSHLLPFVLCFLCLFRPTSRPSFLQ